MQGIFVQVDGVNRRPKSKKEIKDLVAADPWRVTCEATSFFGNDFEGPVTDLPVGKQVHFVGPDPYRDRKFYGTLTRTAGGKVVVK